MDIFSLLIVGMVLCDIVAIVALCVIIKGLNRELHCIRERLSRVEQKAELARQNAYIARRSID